MSYRRTDSQHRSRDHWRGEMALHKAEIRKAQGQPAKREKSPAQVALLAYSKELHRQRVRGERITDEQRARYDELFAAAYAA